MAQQTRKTLEQVVRQVGRYPRDAYVFIQECVGVAADQVHGAMSADEREVAKWMAKRELGYDELREQYLQGRLPTHIIDLLQKIGGVERMNRHVTGQDLCYAVRDTAQKRWGLMARGVLARWNIHRTEDIGAIIFTLVENGWLQKQPSDSIEDFDNVFCFDEAFDGAYRIALA